MVFSKGLWVPYHAIVNFCTMGLYVFVTLHRNVHKLDKIGPCLRGKSNTVSSCLVLILSDTRHRSGVYGEIINCFKVDEPIMCNFSRVHGNLTVGGRLVWMKLQRPQQKQHVTKKVFGWFHVSYAAFMWYRSYCKYKLPRWNMDLNGLASHIYNWKTHRFWYPSFKV